MAKAYLVLKDGTVFEGIGFGARGKTIGEVCFNTSMAGYQEILTDPSYTGQIVTMTYTEIGNYGVNEEDVESSRPNVAGFIVKEFTRVPSNFRSNQSIDEYLSVHNITAISGIDTRALTKIIRDKGAMEGVICFPVSGDNENIDVKDLYAEVKKAPSIAGIDLAKVVTTKETYTWTESMWELGKGYGENVSECSKKYKVVCYDFGVKRNILRSLVTMGFEVTVVPATTSAQEVLEMKPDCVFLSNGPGDPEPVDYAVENIKTLLAENVPIFGICLGHQLLSLALGCKTYKLKFGHRGGNQPVMDLSTKEVEITSQNHGFAVDEDSINKDEIEVTHINLNDKTIEGIKSKKHDAFSVQYHPESSPGPHDSHYLFKRFRDMVEGRVKK